MRQTNPDLSTTTNFANDPSAPRSNMGEIRLDPLQPLHTRPLQSFKIIEGLTTTLHQDIQREYHYCGVMYGSLEPAYLLQGLVYSEAEMNHLVKEYEKRAPYYACGLWAGTGARIKEAALWAKYEKAGIQPKNSRVPYKRVVTQLREEILWCDENLVENLTPSVVRFHSMPSPRSLAEELDATDLNERDRALAESWRGGATCPYEDGDDVDRSAASVEGTCRSSVGTPESDDDFVLIPESLAGRGDGNGKEEDQVLLPNDPNAGTLYVGATSRIIADSGAYSGAVFD
jgi:hypothetical protein